jgi:ribosomal protein L7/L12
MADLKAFAEQLVNLTVKEVNELAQILKDEYGIEPAAAAVAVAGPARRPSFSSTLGRDSLFRCFRIYLSSIHQSIDID